MQRLPRATPRAWHTGCLPAQVMDAVLIVIGLVAAGLVVEAYAAATAPLGYQDEAGFHFGLPHMRDQSGDRAELANPS